MRRVHHPCKDADQTADALGTPDVGHATALTDISECAYLMHVHVILPRLSVWGCFSA